MAQVSIGKRFLAEVRSQYEDWHAAFVREAFQNCADARGTRNLDFTISFGSGCTTVSFSNDGRPMSREEITGKMLTLGESGKEHHETVGGFGRAKELLYFTHEHYQIDSGDVSVAGSGCEYSLSEIPYLHGTASTVTIDEDCEEELIDALRTCVGYSNFRGTVRLNGEVLEKRTRRGRRRDWEAGEGWCSIFTNRQHENLLLVRVNGVYMFSKELYDYKGTVVCELGTSQGLLTSNRDGLRWRYRRALDEFVDSISTNKRAAFKPKRPKYRRYVGQRLTAPITRTFSVDLDTAEKNAPTKWFSAAASDTVGVDLADGQSETVRSVVPEEAVGPGPKSLRAAEPVASKEEATLVYGGHVAVKHDFILRNELCDSIKVPVYYDPGSSRFTDYSRWLTSVWAKCLIELHALFESRAAFSIGFVFDEDTEEGSLNALCEKRSDVGTVYYISPAEVHEASNGVRKFRQRWKVRDKWDILTVAAHEFVHGEGYDRHNESYANRLTDVLGTVMKNRSRFNHCFRGVR